MSSRGLGAQNWVKPVSAGGRTILERLFKSGGASQAALTAGLPLSQPSVARLLGSFKSDGMIRLSDRTSAGRGNPSVHVALEPEFAYGLGVGIVGDAVSVALLDMAGEVRGTQAAAMPRMERTLVTEQVVSLTRALVRRAKVDPDRIVGAGIGFSGYFVGDPPRFNPPEHLADWVDVDVAEAFTGPLGLPVLCENDATAAAVAEAMLGIGRSCANFAYFHLTNGFGGALIVDGKPMRGRLGNAGDFGGVLWMLDEGYPNLDLLRRNIADAGVAFATVEDMVRNIGSETPGVAGWISAAQPPIAKLAFLLGHIVAPEKVVIGGRLPPDIAAALAAGVRLPQTPPRNGHPFPLPRVVASEVDGDAVAVGAAAMPLQHLFFG